MTSLPARNASQYVDIDSSGRSVRIEYQLLNSDRNDHRARPLIVFLHEGLGSVSMWRDFPQTLCDAADCRGLVYSRPGYGSSTPRSANESWGADFMHRQAHEVLPRLLDVLGLNASDAQNWLFGHSDGGSIALLYAARFPKSVSGLIVLAPHIMVEDLSVNNIAATRNAYLHTDLRERLAKYHDDPDSPFWGWNDIWLDPAFRHWSIEDEIASITCPVLAIQGLNDEYGTLEQIHGIARRVPRTVCVELSDCGHSPHRDQPEKVRAEACRFIAENFEARRWPVN